MSRKTIKLLGAEIRAWLEFLFIQNIPGYSGRLIRKFYWSKRFCKSTDFRFMQGCIITSPKNIEMGKGVTLMHDCMLYAHDNGYIAIGDRVSMNNNVMIGAADNGTVIIGANALIGPNVVIRASNHKFELKNVPINQQGHTGGKIVIGEDVWIGANAVILPNVTIGKGAVIGAGAVVTKDIQPYSMAVGVPARVIELNRRV